MIPSLHVFYNNRIKNAALSGGDWALSLDALKNVRLKDIARSADLELTSTQMNVDLGGNYPIRGLMLGPTNATSALQIKLTKHSDDNYDDPIATTGWISWGTQVPFGATPWGTAYLYLGYWPVAPHQRKPWIIMVLDYNIAGQYWTIEIDDNLNPAGYLDIGTAFMSAAFVPSKSYDFSSGGLSYIDQSLSSESLSGSKVFWRRQNKRKWQGYLSNLKNAEGFQDFTDLVNFAGYDDEVFLVPDPSQIEFIQERAFLGRMSQYDPIVQPLPDRVSLGFSVEEVI